MTNRRGFFKSLAALGVGGQTLLKSGDLRAAVDKAQLSAAGPDDWPAMSYRQLGRTGHKASRLFFGCGAALSRRRKDHLLETALQAGINVFDVGFSSYYDSAEMHLAPFLQQHRSKIFLISKAYVPTEIKPEASVSVAEAKRAAAGWLEYLDGSLKELQVEQIDAYYTMAANNVSVVRSDEIYQAFNQAKAAGKVRFLGLSTHQNAEQVLNAAAETGHYDLAMIAITPAGWYDWDGKKILKGTRTLTQLQPVLAKARAAGMGLVGMKAGRLLASRSFFGSGDTSVFDGHYNSALSAAPLSPFQRSYAYVLANGLDVVNADMQNLSHLKENFVAAATADEYQIA